MAIYVDEIFTATPRTPQARRYGIRWCHMTTDSSDLEELHRFALSIGLKREHFQNHATLPHYDLTPSKRNLAVSKGAIELTSAEILQKARRNAQKVEAEVPQQSMLFLYDTF